jgi:hypothetical protein
MSEVLWVAVPGGRRDGEVLLRVLVVPKLDGDSLDTEGMASWPPQELVDATLSVSFAASVEGDTVPADIDVVSVEVAPPHVQAEPGLWESFFGSASVRPARAPAAAPEVQVEDTSARASAIATTFQEAAKARIAAEDAERPAFDAVVREQLETHWSGEGPPRRATASTPMERTAEPDFHRTVSLLREHPTVLRALGLIIELRFAASKIPAGLSEGMVKVEWPGAPAPDGFPRIVSPWTRYGGEFRPASTANIDAGMVALTNSPGAAAGEPGWEVVTVDVDGGAGRLRDAARALAQPDAPPATLPALRTAGMLLVRRGRQADFAARRAASETNAARGSMGNAALTADDLVLGYRIDVKPFGGEWLSLHERDAEYTIDEVKLGPAPEEGHVKAQAAVDEGDGTLRADEVVARWSGWSLAVRPPAFDPRDGRPRPERRPGLPFDFGWEFKVRDRSLPRLRFTGTYRMRARVVDMAGGGLELQEAEDDRGATEPVPYRRFEPVTSPGIALPDGVKPDDLGPGESAHVVLIRSDLGISAEQFADDNPRYGPHAGRVLIAPHTSLAIAEQHGQLDDEDDDRAFELVRRGAARAVDPDKPLPDPAAGGVTAFPVPEPGGVEAGMTERSWPEDTWPDLDPKQLELSERTRRASNALAWQGNRLNVRLAQAEQLTLELSTFLRPDFLDQFAIKEPLPEESEEAANQGRHPMITPATRVTLVHPVRRPLSDPAGKLTPRREAEQTFAILEPDPVLLGVDTKSTGQLAVTASWAEPLDDKTQKVADAPVQKVIIGRGDEALKDQLRHEFGDTRHRNVTYALTAASRFRAFFRADEKAEAFVARTTLSEVMNVLSSARPAPPVVLSARPAFRWEQQVSGEGPTRTVQRTRFCGRVRVELERPWFQTGEGEQLALIVTDAPEPDEALQPFLTQLGRDPIWDTPIPNRWPAAAEFAGGVGDPRKVKLAETGAEVMAVAHEVWFHEDRWYADVDLPGLSGNSYSPFMELSVARYQPDSLEGLDLSRVVKTEMVSLLPHRTMKVRRSGSEVFVSLTGLGPTGPIPNRVDAVLERAELPAGVDPRAVELTALESPSDGTPAWMQVEDGTRQTDLAVKDQNILFEIPSGGGVFRVRVREVELVGSDGDPIPGIPGTGDEFAERTVFTDVVMLEDL